MCEAGEQKRREDFKRFAAFGLVFPGFARQTSVEALGVNTGVAQVGFQVLVAPITQGSSRLFQRTVVALVFLTNSDSRSRARPRNSTSDPSARPSARLLVQPPLAGTAQWTHIFVQIENENTNRRFAQPSSGRKGGTIPDTRVTAEPNDRRHSQWLMRTLAS
jgi:hypothetical protein